MENKLISNNNENNIENEFSSKIKSCPFCNMYLSLIEYQDHILSHEIDQNENGNLSNNINGYGLQNKNNKIQENKDKDKSPEFLNKFINSANTFFNSIKNNDKINNIINIKNNINGNNNNTPNNSNNQNRTNINIKDSITNINKKIKNNIEPIVSNVTGFFKHLVNSDDSSSSGDESPTIRLPTFRIGRTSNDNFENNRNNNSPIRDRNELFDELISDILFKKEDDDYQEILKYIPSSTIKEPKNPSDNNKCVICLSEFQVGEKESTLPCLHIFHSNCIEKWIIEKKWCPICKYNLNLDSILSNNNY